MGHRHRIEHTFRVDASYDLPRAVTGIGVVLHRGGRRRDGQIVATFSEAYLDVPPGLTEKFAVFRALEIAKEMNLAEVKIRSDYNQMRRQLKDDYRAGSTGDERDVLHKLVLLAARELDRVEFAFVPRRRNQQAHELARQARQNPHLRSRPDIPWPVVRRRLHHWQLGFDDLLFDEIPIDR